MPSIKLVVILIIGGGTFKQVLIDGGVGDTIAKCSKVLQCHLSYLLGQYYVLRGLTTVGSISTTGIVLPLLQHLRR